MTSRAAEAFATRAGAGGLALQACAACSAVQYPPRDVCGRCLGDELPWCEVASGGTVLAVTVARVSVDAIFREQLPLSIGLVALDCGPIVVTFLADACGAGAQVRVQTRLDHEGRGVLSAEAA